MSGLFVCLLMNIFGNWFRHSLSPKVDEKNLKHGKYGGLNMAIVNSRYHILYRMMNTLFKCRWYYSACLEDNMTFTKDIGPACIISTMKCIEFRYLMIVLVLRQANP